MRKLNEKAMNYESGDFDICYGKESRVFISEKSFPANTVPYTKLINILDIEDKIEIRHRNFICIVDGNSGEIKAGVAITGKAWKKC